MFVFYICCSDCVGVCGNIWCVAAVVEYSVFSHEVLKYYVCLCKGCDRCCIFCLYCDQWRCMCSCMGSMSVSSCSMFVSCVQPVAILNAAFCMTFRVLFLVEDTRGDHMGEAPNDTDYSNGGPIDRTLGPPKMRRYPPSTIYRYLNLPSTQKIQTHKSHILTPHHPSRPWSKSPTHSPPTPSTPPQPKHKYTSNTPLFPQDW